MTNCFKKKDADAVSSARLGIRLTRSDYADIEIRAAQAKLSMSEFVKRCALSKRVDMRYDVDIILELRNAADRVRELHADSRTHLSDDEVRAALIEVVRAIERI